VLLGHSGSEARVSVGSSGDGKGLALRFGRVRGGAEGWLVSRGFDSGLVFRRVSSNHLGGEGKPRKVKNAKNGDHFGIFS